MKDQEVIDLGWNAYVNEVKDSYVDVGIITRDANKPVNGSFNLGQLARVQEYGIVINVTDKMRRYLAFKGLHLKADTKVIRIPSRPFMRQTFDEQWPELSRFMERMEDNVISGRMDRKTALEIIGDFHKSEIQKNMRTKDKFEPNHPFTIEQKGSDNELIDSGRLANSIDIDVNVI